MYELNKHFIKRVNTVSRIEYSYMYDKPEIVIEELKNKFLDKKMKEILLTSSNELYYAFIKEPNNEKVINKLDNYFIRATSRPTPFGLVSFLKKGVISSLTDMKENNFLKYVRPDSEWLLKVLEDYNCKWESHKNEKFYWNHTVLESNKFFQLSNNKKTKFNSDTLIERNNLLDFIKKKTFNGINTCDLLEEIKFYLSNKQDGEEIIRYLLKLLKSKLLLSTFIPPFNNNDMFNSFLEKISKIQEYSLLYNKLYKIRKDLNQYSHTDIGKGIDLYNSIVTQMKVIKKSNNYLHIDFISKGIDCLDISVESEIEDFIGFLDNHCIYKDRYPHITKYIYKFIEKYGYDREVPLNEVLNENIGIGYPPEMNDTEYNFEYIELSKKIKNYILFNSLENTRIDLEKLFKDLNIETNKINSSKNESCEVYTKIFKKKNNEKIRFFISPSSGSLRSGKSIGRFKYTELFEEFSFNKTGDDYVELVDYPKKEKIINVASNYSESHHEFNIGTLGNFNVNQISLTDLVVGVKNNNGKNFLYFKNIKDNKQMIFDTNNMVHHSGRSIYSKLSRFLLEVSNHEINNPFNIFRIIESINDLPFIPEIKYKNIILSTRTWIFNKEGINFKNQKELQSILQEWLESKDIPNIICIYEFDSYMTLNLKNKNHFIKLSDYIIKNSGNYIKINESPWNQYDAIESNETEYIFFLENKDVKKTNELTCSYNDISSNNRIYSLGSEWIFFKLYLNYDSKGLYIIDLYFNLLNNLKDQVVSFHYLFYKDPDKHIRFRINMKSKKDVGIIISYINDIFEKLCCENEARRIVYDTYNREIERYGGINLIGSAEKLFHIDSLICSNINNKYENKEIKSIISMMILMKKLGLNYTEQLSIFDLKFDKNKYRKEFREINNKYKMIKPLIRDYLLFNKNTSEFNLFELINSEYEIYNDFLEAYKIGIANSPDKNNIILSHLHMHFNRLGINNKLEKKIMYIYRHLLHSIYYFAEKETLIDESN